MANLTQKQFGLSYEIIGGAIRVMDGGVFKNPQGEEVSYLPSVRINCTNIEEGELDPELGFANSVDRHVTFKIPCDTRALAVELARSLHPMLQKKEPIYCDGRFAVRKNDGTFEVTVLSVKNLGDSKKAK